MILTIAAAERYISIENAVALSQLEVNYQVWLSFIILTLKCLNDMSVLSINKVQKFVQIQFLQECIVDTINNQIHLILKSYLLLLDQFLFFLFIYIDTNN